MVEGGRRVVGAAAIICLLRVFRVRCGTYCSRPDVDTRCHVRLALKDWLGRVAPTSRIHCAWHLLDD